MNLPIPISIIPKRKLNVFVSSACGDGKEHYNEVRQQIKSCIESTGIADVYLFEDAPASTLTAGQAYLSELKDSDVCIFLIDNADGVPSGVQAEVDCAKKHRIKSLYYFCDERSTEKTPLQKSLTGATFAKSKTIHSFSDFISNSTQGLVDDIITIYRQYCKNRMEMQNETNTAEASLVDVDVFKTSLAAPKSVIENIDKCKLYFLKLVTARDGDVVNRTCDFDNWCERFLGVLFEHESIHNFNANLFLKELEKNIPGNYYKVVALRWDAIQAYYLGNLESCISSIESALSLAKELNMPDWIIKDILIDLRNQRMELGQSHNKFILDEAAQKEIQESDQALYYPLIDRVHATLYERYINQLIKHETESPYTIYFGHNIEQYISLIAQSYSIAMYNGSLTHLILTHKQVKVLSFFLSSQFDNWEYKLSLLKETIISRSEKEIAGLNRAFPDISVKLSSDEAIDVLDYCNNIPIFYQRLSAKLYAIEFVGYLLNDETFFAALDEIIQEIDEWISSESRTNIIGATILKSLGAISHRIGHNTLADVCCKYFDNNFKRWYDDIFKLISSQHIDIQRMDTSVAEEFIKRIENCVSDDKIRHNTAHLNGAIIILRKQSQELTKGLDLIISEKMPEFYEGDYKLETTTNIEKDIPKFISKYIQEIRARNIEQGKNGTFHGYADDPHEIIRAIIINHPEFQFSMDSLDEAFKVAMDTIFLDTQELETKCSSIDLLLCLSTLYPKIVKENQDLIDKAKLQINEIQSGASIFSMSNLSEIAVKFSSLLLMSTWGENNCAQILEILPYTKDDSVSAIRICKTIYYYLSNTPSAVLPSKLEPIILQYVVSQISSEVNDLRWYAIRALILLSQNPDNRGIVESQLLHALDNGNIFVKNIILRDTYQNDYISKATKEYIICQCRKDRNFVIRKLCNELIPL